MRVYSIVLVIMLAAIGTRMEGTVVTIDNEPLGRYLTDASGVRLPNGCTVLLGYFADESVIDTALPAADMALLADWELFGSTETISIFDYAGKLGGDVANDSASAGWFEGKPIYLWVFNGSTIFDSTQYGIFTASLGNSPWLFGPAGEDSQTLISLENPGLVALVGAVDGNRLMLTGVVPEPATYAALCAGVALGVVAWRRRRVTRR